MSSIPIHRLGFFRISRYGMRNCQRLQNSSPSLVMKTNSNPSRTRKMEDEKTSLPQLETSPSNIRFNRLQPLHQEFIQDDMIDFGQFVVREALLDEEYWTAAWLRGETYWDDRTNDRYVENYKRKFAEQEFNALKRLCKKQHMHKCIVTVKKEERNVKHNVLKSVVGTLDLSIRYLLIGETFPGQRVKSTLFCSIDKTEQKRYGYIENLCVAKSSRRQGIASTMLCFAINLARTNGVEQVFVHVYRNNRLALELYQKMGFQVVEMATSQLSKEQTYLLCFIIA